MTEQCWSQQELQTERKEREKLWEFDRRKEQRQSKELSLKSGFTKKGSVILKTRAQKEKVGHP